MPSSRSTERAPLASMSTADCSSRPRPPASATTPGHAGVPRRGDRRPLDALRSGYLDQILEPKGGRHAAGGRIDLRLVEEHERVQRLHHVAAVQIDQVVARLDQLVEDVVGQRLGEAALAVAGERAVRVLRVLGRNERRALQNEAGFTNASASTRPESSLGSSSRTSERTAWIEEYSQPCTPASRQSVGPSAAPRTSTIGNSTPARAGLSNLWSRRSIMLDLARDADIASRPSSQTEGAR